MRERTSSCRPCASFPCIENSLLLQLGKIHCLKDHWVTYHTLFKTRSPENTVYWLNTHAAVLFDVFAAIARKGYTGGSGTHFKSIWRILGHWLEKKNFHYQPTLRLVHFFVFVFVVVFFLWLFLLLKLQVRHLCSSFSPKKCVRACAIQSDQIWPMKVARNFLHFVIDLPLPSNKMSNDLPHFWHSNFSFLYLRNR